MKRYEVHKSPYEFQTNDEEMLNDVIFSKKGGVSARKFSYHGNVQL